MKKILINVEQWQTRIAITDNKLLQNIYFASHHVQPLERSFFKGSVVKVLPGIQTAFVDIGQPKAGFLHISEVDRELAMHNLSAIDEHLEEAEEHGTEQRPHYAPVDIKDIFQEGEPVLVQVSKEPVYEKGAKLTTCFTLPGRFIVLMPNIPRISISKKIEDREERQRLKETVRSMLPEGMGAIIRTTAEESSQKAIAQDVSFLLAAWAVIQKRYAEAKPQENIYEDLDLTLQVVRDHLNDDVEEVLIDDQTAQQKVYNFVKKMAPEYSSRIKLYMAESPLFTYYGLETQIDETLHKKVHLKSGGSLIIESTEAMTVIDVNTGKFTGKSSMEETIFKINLEAAQEAVRQLRLRNIGGLIVIDFIDMATAAHRQKLFKSFEKTLKEHDKFQSVVLKISEFGLIQMTRKRSGKTLVQQLTSDCATCHGSGFIKSMATQAYAVLRMLKQELSHYGKSAEITIYLNPDTFEFISTVEYNSILMLEKIGRTKITLGMQKDLAIDSYHIVKKG